MGEVPLETDEPTIGSVLGPYELVAPIGAGGMARVWAARVRGSGELVALKMLLPELSLNVEFRQMFFDEAAIASRIRHLNVCATHELREHGGLLFIVMEWIDGPSVMRLLHPGSGEATDSSILVPIRPRIAARVVADACAGLHAAHELVGDDCRLLGVVHRDVSPHNLILTSDGHVKVTDFGVAKALGKSHETVAGQLKGKVAYMAPEQLVGGDVDRRSDVFALGCVLYEITTGRRPFQGEFDPQVMAAIMMGRFDPPSAVVRGYPPELETIVMTALANEPELRYSSAERMRAALEAYLRRSGPAVGTAQLSALVAERVGREFEARAASLHEALAATSLAPGSRTSMTSLGPHESGAAMEVDGGEQPARGVAWLVASVLVGAALGVGVLWYVQTTRRERATAITTTTTTATATATAISTQAPTGAETSTPSADGPEQPKGAGRVRLAITPASALLVVDGVVLPPGTTTVARPDGDAAIHVLVRADKHVDTIVVVDAATPDEVEVTLASLTSLTALAPTPRRVHPNAADAGAAAANGDGKGKTPKPPENTIETPPNPYE